MSAIGGIISSQPDKHADLQRINAVHKRRGPDNCDIWSDQNQIGLCHASLHSTPESLLETQPFLHQPSRHVITADARIDNREELGKKLSLSKEELKTIGDAQLILLSYLKWKDSCPRHLIGSFSFAIWNPLEQTLFCARDHLGVYPFYYYKNSNLFIFSSSANGILIHPHVKREINEARIFDFLSEELEGSNLTDTFFKNIYCLPPASSLTVKNSQVHIETYWTPDTATELKLSSDEEYTEAFLDVYTQSVRSQLRSHSPAGAMLSGGMDSSSIVSIAKELTGENSLHTFSALGEAWETSKAESSAIQTILNEGGLQSHLFRPDEIQFNSEDLESFIRHCDDPFDFGMLNYDYLIYQKAKDLGLSSVLNGIDGDVVLWQNFQSIPFLLKKGKLQQAYHVTRSACHFYEKSTLYQLFRSTRSAWGVSQFPALQRLAYKKRLDRTCRQIFEQRPFLRASFAEEVNMRERVHDYQHQFPQAQTIREKHAQVITNSHLPAALGRYNRCAAYHSIESRAPLLDKRLVDFAISLPWQQKTLGGMSKPILRKAFQNRLPSSITQRKNWESVGPEYYFSFWKNSQALIDYAIEDCLDYLSPYVDIDQIKALYPKFQTQKSPLQNWGDSIYSKLWDSALLALWLKSQEQQA